jgi:hypothetical protein
MLNLFWYLVDLAVQVLDTTSKQWRLIKDWMQSQLHGGPCPSVAMEDAMDLLPVVHKVCDLI